MNSTKSTTLKWMLLLTLSVSILLVITGCGKKAETNELQLESSDKHPVVTIEMSNDKVIKVELFPEVAPNTVNNMISLVQAGFYDGKIFHRVIPKFMVQAGELVAADAGQPDYTIKGEFANNGFKNFLLHERGVISTARVGGMNDSASTQFFIMVNKNAGLDGDYAAFGKVVEGIEVADEIAAQPRDGLDRPNKDPLYMKKVTVDLKGMTFPEPEVIR
ncbi:peptidylprolyl isomerase [Paenibacillus yanchengensis]|uniref:Peptidyl-prolyl cis-trans isomerase n=1 Tax=Paenibacillus yanchengensis TaxID=2035833 RepID=A0ABW4YGW7_9BACL